MFRKVIYDNHLNIDLSNVFQTLVEVMGSENKVPAFRELTFVKRER